MTLVSSGAISLGGSTTNQSVNLELLRSATASINMNETEVRRVANKRTVSSSISMSDFYGRGLPYLIDANAGASQASGAPLTWSHTTTAATTILIVGCFCQNNGNSITVASVTFNGIALTQLQESSANGGCGAVFYLLNPPVGTFTISMQTSSGGSDRGIAGQSMNIGGATGINTSVLGDNNTTDPRTVTTTSSLLGLAIGHVKITGVGGTLFLTTSTAPTGMTAAVAARRFTSNSNAKHNEIFYSATIVAAGSTSFTNDITQGNINARSLIYALVE